MQLTSIRSSSITSIIFNSATIQWNPGGRNCSLSTPFYQPLEPRNVHSQRGLMIQRRTSHDSPKQTRLLTARFSTLPVLSSW